MLLNEGTGIFGGACSSLPPPREVGIVCRIFNDEQPRQILPRIPSKRFDAPTKKPKIHIMKEDEYQDGLGTKPEQQIKGMVFCLPDAFFLAEGARPPGWLHPAAPARVHFLSDRTVSTREQSPKAPP